MSTPKVSVILPTFDRLAYLPAAIGSVAAQTFADWELIVVDDGSSDGTASFLERLENPRIRPLRLPHSGNPSGVRNAGIRLARGRYLAFLDSDDLWEPTKLEVQLGLMHARPERRWSYTKEHFIDAHGAPVSEANFPSWVPYEGAIVERLLTVDALISMPTVIAERALVEAAGGFDEQQRFGEDYDLWIRLAMLSEVSASPEALAAVRLHPTSYSADRAGANEGWFRLYGKMASLVPSDRLAALCRRRQGETALRLAGIYGDRWDFGRVAHTLLAAPRNCWTDRDWCFGAAKAALRPLVPRVLLASHRRRRTTPEPSGGWPPHRGG